MAGIAAGLIWWSTPRRPNFLLITLDTTRADRLGCYGHAGARTPTLDALAKSGVRFSQAYATAPLTLPSHATMMTDCTRPSMGCGPTKPPAFEIPTLAETLQQTGYRTGAFVGAFVLDATFGLHRGFDKYDADLSQTRRTDDPLHRERPGNVVVDRALEWLGVAAQRPFFCWVHLYDPHFPYQPHVDVFGEDFQEQPYDGELAFVDRQVARLTEFLKSNGLTENTLVMVVGDHGEGLGDHQETMHGYMLYNSTLHVPWLAAWPGRIPPDVVVTEPVSLVDLLPTSLECLQMPPPAGTTGQSLMPAFSGQPITPSTCYAETDDPRLDNGWSGLQMLLTPDWKYIRTADPELYRLSDDLAEQHDLADAEVEQVQSLDRDLLDFLSGLTPRKTDLAALSSRDVRILSSLGYTAGQSSAQPLGDWADRYQDRSAAFQSRRGATHLMEAGQFIRPSNCSKRSLPSRLNRAET
jgi:arylsulfatase A-like enzyme